MRKISHVINLITNQWFRRFYILKLFQMHARLCLIYFKSILSRGLLLTVKKLQRMELSAPAIFMAIVDSKFSAAPFKLHEYFRIAFPRLSNHQLLSDT